MAYARLPRGAAEAIDAGDTAIAARQGPVAASMVNACGWASALFADPPPLNVFHALGMPILYRVGGRSPASSLGVARLLSKVLSQARMLAFPDLGQMGPVTHPERVNGVIRHFLSQR
jgi:pimeloyl-ACP methyl ester carboxylesterase